MSPLLPDRLQVVLAPGGIRLVRQRGWLKPRRIDSAAVPCAAADGALWQAPVATLQALLAEPRWQGAPLTLTLSDRLLHYQLLPWLPELGSPDESLSYARFHFRQVYGAAADDWEIRVDDTLPGLPVVACAADRALAGALEALAGAAGTRLVGIRTAFASVFNRLRRHLTAARDDTVVLAVAEPGGLCYALLSGGRMTSLHQRSLVTDPAETLRQALAEECLMADTAFTRATAYLVALPDGNDNGLEELGATWTVRQLTMVGDVPGWSDEA